MPPNKKVKALLQYSTNCILKYLLSNIFHYSTADVKLKQRAYFESNVPSDLRQKLLNQCLAIDNYDFSFTAKCKVTELLADASTQSLDFTNNGAVSVNDVIRLYNSLKISECRKLINLSINCKIKVNEHIVITDFNKVFYKILRNLKNLQWITLRGIADRKLMCIIGEGCHKVVYLDVRNSPEIDDLAVANLLINDPVIIKNNSPQEIVNSQLNSNNCAKTLEFVCLSNTLTTIKSTVLLLKTCPRLKSFGDHTNESTSTAVALIQPKDQAVLLKLEHLSDSRILPEHASLLSSVCPNLSFIDVTGRSLPYLHFIETLTKIYLDLEMKSYFSEYVYNYMFDKGKYLTHIIIHNDITDPIDLYWFIDATPNLQVLKSSIVHSEVKPASVWKRLNLAFITISSSACLKYFVRCALLIEELKINFYEIPYMEANTCLNDDLISDMMSNGYIRKLKVLSICECSIGICGIDSLLLHCPNLQSIGSINRWQNVSNYDIEQLKSKIKMSNWDLDLKCS